jgi:hypothetical protein
MTRTNRHLLCVYYFTSYARYMYVAVPIQQGTRIIEYITFGVLLCVTHFGSPGCTNNNVTVLRAGTYSAIPN